MSEHRYIVGSGGGGSAAKPEPGGGGGGMYAPEQTEFFVNDTKVYPFAFAEKSLGGVIPQCERHGPMYRDSARYEWHCTADWCWVSITDEGMAQLKAFKEVVIR